MNWQADPKLNTVIFLEKVMRTPKRSERASAAATQNARRPTYCNFLNSCDEHTDVFTVHIQEKIQITKLLFALK